MWLEFSQSGRCSSCMMLHCWHICWIPHFEGLICLTRNDARPCNTSPELQNWQKSRLQMKSNVSPSPLCQAVTLDQVMPFIERQPPYDVATSFILLLLECVYARQPNRPSGENPVSPANFSSNGGACFQQCWMARSGQGELVFKESCTGGFSWASWVACIAFMFSGHDSGECKAAQVQPIMVADPLPISVLVGLTFALHTVHASCCAAFNRTGPVAGSPVPSSFPRGLPGWVL